MFYSPFTELGRLAGEVGDIQRQVNDCLKRWELSKIQNEIIGLESKLQRIENDMNELRNKITELEVKPKDPNYGW